MSEPETHHVIHFIGPWNSPDVLHLFKAEWKHETSTNNNNCSDLFEDEQQDSIIIVFKFSGQFAVLHLIGPDVTQRESNV